MARKKREQRDIDPETREKARALYAAYPRKRDPDKAVEAIAEALEDESFEVLLASVRRYSDSTVGKPQYFIPYASTWFKQRRWKLLEGPVRNMRDVDSVLAIARSQLATPDEAWSLVRRAASAMELDYSAQSGSTVKRCGGNQAIADAVPEPARSVAMSLRWTQIRFGDEAKVRQEFFFAYRERVKAEVNRRVAPSLLGAVGLPGVEQRRIGE